MDIVMIRPGFTSLVLTALLAGVTAATLSVWHDASLAGGEAALTTKPATGEELENDRIKAKPDYP